MEKILVGYTGFVGSNLNRQCNFDMLYNSKNIKDSYGTNPYMLVYSGVRAEKFLANTKPQEDFSDIQEAINNIKNINPKKLILISTIDVYENPISVDEDSKIIIEKLQPYGYNRFILEEWVKNNIDNYLIIRLPGLYGYGLKKNFIYDMVEGIPIMLNMEVFKTLKNRNNRIEFFYERLNDIFYKCKELTKEERGALKKNFLDAEFTSLNFTDYRSQFQFYNLDFLWKHISIAINNNIKILNIATEPIACSELFEYINQKKFTNETKGVVNYDFRTKYDNVFDGKNGYILDKNFVMMDIKKFVERNVMS